MLAEIAPQLEWMLIQAELVLAIWLFVGWWSRLSWFATLLLFSCFVGASLVMVIQGRSSCGCLGAVELNPIWMLLFDLLSIGVLLLSGRGITVTAGMDSTVVAASLPALHPFLSVSHVCGWILAGGLLGGLAVSQSAAIGSTISQYVPKEFSGQYLVTNPTILDVGTGQPGNWRTLKITVHNRSENPVTLIGAEQGCRCRAIGSLPMEIKANDQAEIEVSVQLGKTAGVQHDRFWMLTSHQRQGLLICRWRANVVASQEISGSTVSSAMGGKPSSIKQISSPVSGKESIQGLIDHRLPAHTQIYFVNLVGVWNRVSRLRMPVEILFPNQGVL